MAYCVNVASVIHPSQDILFEETNDNFNFVDPRIIEEQMLRAQTGGGAESCEQ